MIHLLPLLVFVCGAFYEASCVGFVGGAQKSRPGPTSIMSMLAGCAEITGVFSSVRNWHVAPFYILGLGTGAYVGVTVKQRMERSDFKEGSTCVHCGGFANGPDVAGKPICYGCAK